MTKNLTMSICIFLLCSLIFAQEQSDFFFTKKKKFITEKSLNALIQNSDIIYVGETHDQPQCHIAQLKTIMALNETKKGKIVVGFEMLNQTLQPILDEYVEGKLSEEEFLNKVNWKKEWGFDFSLYQPIFSYIRENKLKALALNVPRNVISKIARNGLEGLSEDEKKLIAKKIEINNDKKYINYLKESFSGHGDTPMSKMFKWENYLLSMATWNETMGEKISDFLKNNKEYSAVVIAGNGHIMYNAAIPWSVKKRIKNIKALSIYTEDIENKKDLITKNDKLADIIWFVKFENKENK